MIEEKITGSKRNIMWIKDRFLNDPEIAVQRISEVYPVKDTDGMYCLFIRYKRVIRHKRKSRW